MDHSSLKNSLPIIASRETRCHIHHIIIRITILFFCWDKNKPYFLVGVQDLVPHKSPYCIPLLKSIYIYQDRALIFGVNGSLVGRTTLRIPNFRYQRHPRFENQTSISDGKLTQVYYWTIAQLIIII